MSFDDRDFIFKFSEIEKDLQDSDKKVLEIIQQELSDKPCNNFEDVLNTFNNVIHGMIALRNLVVVSSLINLNHLYLMHGKELQEFKGIENKQQQEKDKPKFDNLYKAVIDDE